MYYSNFFIHIHIMKTSAILTIGLLCVWCSLCVDDKDKSDQRMLGYALGFGLLFILVCKNLYSEEEEDEECTTYEYVTNEPANEPANGESMELILTYITWGAVIVACGFALYYICNFLRVYLFPKPPLRRLPLQSEDVLSHDID